MVPVLLEFIVWLCEDICIFPCVWCVYMHVCVHISVCKGHVYVPEPMWRSESNLTSIWSSLCCYTHQLQWPESSRSSVPHAGVCICHTIIVLTSQWRVTQTVAHMSRVQSCLLPSGDPWSQGSPVVPQRMSGHICFPATANGSTVCAVCTSLCEWDLLSSGINSHACFW